MLANEDTEDDYNTQLHFAVINSDIELVKICLEKGADVNAKNQDGETPLHMAVAEEHIQIVEYLLKRGVDVNYKCFLGAANRSYTPLRRAIWQQDEKIVELLLSFGANVDAQIEGGETILQSAVESENPIIIDHILNYCPDLNNEGNKTALNTAVCEYGKEYPQIVDKLLRYGFTVDPNVLNYPELQHAAVAKGYLKIVDELLKHGTDVNTSCENSNTLLHTAIKNKQEEVAELLISYVADVNVKDDTGKTPIFYATENGDLKMIKLLLSNRANVNDDPELLITVIKNEIANAKEEIINLLLSGGANVNAHTQRGDTALHAATASGYVKIVKTLLEYNADVNSTIKNYITPLHISAQSGNVVIVKMLLSRGANVNAKQEGGKTALHIATREGHEEVIEVLLRCGANVESRAEKFMTPLHIAAENTRPKVVEVLLKFGANIDSVDKFGRTALHIASKEGYQNIVKNLLKHGCDINIKNNKDQTPLRSAVAGINSFLNMNANYYGSPGYHNDIFAFIRCHFACQNNLKILQNHVILMKTANIYVNKNDLLSINKTDNLNHIQDECKKEIAHMKSEKINNTNVSYYDILTKDINQIAKYARNENIVRVFRSDDHKTKFPLYVNMIESNFRKGKIQRELLEQGNKCFRILSNKILELPYNCTEKIFGYLSDADLRILISTFRKVKERKELLEQSYRLFYFLLNDFPTFPFDCVEKIFSYLKDEDLGILIKACKPTNIGRPNTLQVFPNAPKRERKRKLQ